MEKLAVSAVAFKAIVGEAYSSTVSTIWTSVTRWTGCTIIVVCMIMTTGCASTKSNKGSSDQHILLLPLHSVPAGNASRNRARGRRFLRSLVVLVRESAEANGAGAG